MQIVLSEALIQAQNCKKRIRFLQNLKQKHQKYKRRHVSTFPLLDGAIHTMIHYKSRNFSI